jgi:hypothetical protein
MLNIDISQLTEDELRKEIICILKRTIPGITKVKDICGNNESGIDILFIRQDPFGVERYYGIQVKAKDIKSTESTVSHDVKTIIGQIVIAFGSPFEDNRFLDGIYVVTSGEIKKNASDYLRSAKIGFRELYIIEGQDLAKFIIYGRAALESMRVNEN